MFEGACHRFPDLNTVGVKQWFNGIESFTEDGMFILGEAPQARRFFIGAGFNSFGIASGGGAGKALAHWVMEGEPPFDLWAADIRRFSAYHGSRSQVLVRALEGQGDHYAMHWPHKEATAGRPFRRSPLYHRLQDNGACFGTKSGWERANWFATEGQDPVDDHSFSRANWFDVVAQEHRACRETAALFDQSSFAKFKLVGKDAESALQQICGANMARPEGTVIYTQMLNGYGGIEADITVTRLAEDVYYIVTGTGFATRDYSHIERSLAAECDAHLVDVTSGYGCLSLMGPQSRAILSAVAEG